MSEIKQRLEETSANCLKAYVKWDANKKSSSDRESLLEAIHELRKVASRLEIELAISERDQNAQKPIPIPPHRDARPKSSRGNDDDNIGNKDPDDPGKPPPPRRKPSGGPKKQG